MNEFSDNQNSASPDSDTLMVGQVKLKLIQSLGLHCLMRLTQPCLLGCDELS